MLWAGEAPARAVGSRGDLTAVSYRPDQQRSLIHVALLVLWQVLQWQQKYNEVAVAYEETQRVMDCKAMHEP